MHSAEEAEGLRIRYTALEYTMSAVAYAAAGDTLRLANAVDSVAALAARSVNQRSAYLAAHARGLLALARTDTAAAITEFTRAIWSPTTGFTQSNLDLAKLLLARGRSQEAIAILNAALRGNLDGTNLYVSRTVLHEFLGEAYAAQGRTDSAAVHFRWVAVALANADAEARPRFERASQFVAANDADPESNNEPDTS